jgi:hypothetical protein
MVGMLLLCVGWLFFDNLEVGKHIPSIRKRRIRRFVGVGQRSGMTPEALKG